MICISETYEAKWMVGVMPEYQFAKKKLFNVKRGKEVKKVLKGYSVGYNLRGKFYTLKQIQKMIKPVEKIECPF
jgi:hypothetical protein